MKKKSTLTKFFEIVFVLSLILTNSTMYGVLSPFYNNGKGPYLLRVLCLIQATVLIFIYIFVCDRKILKKQWIKLLGFLAFFIVYFLITRFKVKSCLESLTIPFILFFLICSLNNSKVFFCKFFNIYTKIVVSISCISLFFYLFGTTLKLLQPTPIQYFNNGEWNSGSSYYNLYFINDWQTQNLFGKVFIRNVGIFMEAPGYAIVLTLALYWELFSNRNINKLELFILLCTLFTTFSAIGYIITGILFFVYLYSKKGDEVKLWRNLKYCFFPFVLLALIVLVKYVLNQKIINTGDNGSWAIRMNDIYSAFCTWKDYPIFGAGFYNLDKIYSHYIISRTVGNPTCGILNILAYGGIVSLIWYALGYLNYLKLLKFNDFKIIVNSLLIITVLLFATSALQYNYIFIFILGLGYSLHSLNLNDQRHKLQLKHK